MLWMKIIQNFLKTKFFVLKILIWRLVENLGKENNQQQKLSQKNQAIEKYSKKLKISFQKEKKNC